MGWGIFGKSESREHYRPMKKLWLFVHPCYDEYYVTESDIVKNYKIQKAYPLVRQYYKQIVSSLEDTDGLCIIPFTDRVDQADPHKKNVTEYLTKLANLKKAQTVVLKSNTIQLGEDSSYLKIIGDKFTYSPARLHIHENTKIYATGERSNNCLDKYSLTVAYSGKNTLQAKNPILFFPKTLPDQIIQNKVYEFIGLQNQISRYEKGYTGLTLTQVIERLDARELRTKTRADWERKK